jgi:hypothetical protein
MAIATQSSFTTAACLRAFAARARSESPQPICGSPTAIELSSYRSYPPSLSKEDTANRPIGMSPPDNRTKFRVVEFGPLDAASEAKMPPDMIMKGSTIRRQKGLPLKHAMMHCTRSLDYAVILSGEIDMMLDDGTPQTKVIWLSSRRQITAE